MADWTAEQFAQVAFDLGLLDERQLQQLWGEFGSRNVPPEDFVALALRREFMTSFQIDRMDRGERHGYFYGKYKVLYVVAGGSFARVYRAVHKDTGQMVALKVLRRRYSDDSAHTEHFRREGQVGLTLRHPNIVPIFEVGQDGRSHFLVMEFIEGNNLREFLKVRRKLEALEATRLVIGICTGLRYAAQRGISHRDLKLTNVLVSSRGEPKLVDFGLAGADTNVSDEKIEDNDQRTIDYAGLERATNVRKGDPRSDLYFLGAIFYHLLAGRAPFADTRDRIQRLSQSRFTDVKPLSEVEPSAPPIVARFVNKSMQVDPDQRFQSATQMLAELKALEEKLASGQFEADPEPDAAEGQRQLALEAGRKSLMVVEANVKHQNVFREALKNDGYRVLVTSDPQRALSRFTEQGRAADCVVFSTSQLGQAAIDGFVEFATGEFTKDLPTVLLLDDANRDGAAKKIKRHLSDQRIVVPLPIKMKGFRQVLAKLVPPAKAE